MFYLIEDNDYKDLTKNKNLLKEAALNDGKLIESLSLQEGNKVTDAIGAHFLGKKVEITESEAKALIPKVQKGIKTYIDTCVKYSGKLSFRFRKNAETYKKDLCERIENRINAGIKKGKIVITMQLPLPVFAKDLELSRIEGPYKKIVRATDSVLPKYFTVGLTLNRGFGVSPTAYFSQLWLASERLVIKK